jgi:hypothetical protein
MPRKRQKPIGTDNVGIEQILSYCYKLTLCDLKLIREAIDLMIARLEYKEFSPAKRQELRIDRVGLGARGSTGYIESKTIRGHGPYLYLRMRREGIHHSFYLGKDED